jgi:hypothetical protein
MDRDSGRRLAISEDLKWANLGLNALMVATIISWAEAWLTPIRSPALRGLGIVAGIFLAAGVIATRLTMVGLAWLLALVGACHAVVLWIRHGSSAPYQEWSVFTALAFVVLAPWIWRAVLRSKTVSIEEQARLDQDALKKRQEQIAWTFERRRQERLHAPERRWRYGTELATKVADFLGEGGEIRHAHRDYCGTGLCFAEGRFVYDEVEDGFFRSLREQTRAPLAVFDDRGAFITWLAAQSDDSLSGKERGDDWYTDNQRITRERLEEAVRASGISSC